MNKVNEISPLSKMNQSAWYKVKSPDGDEEYIPKIMDIKADYLKQYLNKSRFNYFIFI